MITEAKLPPRKGYVERVDNNGNHYYRKLIGISGYSKQSAIITESDIFITPAAKDNMFTIQIIGGGGDILAGKNGSNSISITKSLNIPPNTKIFVNIGKAGFDGSSGEPSSFGEYVVSLGGAAGGEDSRHCYITIGSKIYGAGANKANIATDGICIISYDAPMYI